MKKILITGGAGFIGSHLTKRLVKQGHEIIVIDNLERGKKEFIGDVLDKITFAEKDLRNYDLDWDQYFSGVDVVVHLASKVGGIGTYMSKPYEIMSDNLSIDSNVLSATLKYGINNYFYASSAHIYPKELQTVMDSPKIHENDAYPANCELSYGWAKLVGEKQIEYATNENKDFRAAIARFIGIYGQNQDYALATGSVIPVFSHRAIKYPDVPFSVWGTGVETRSYCFIEDTLECIELMINKMGEIKIVGPLNVGKEERCSISEIADTIVDISGKDITIEYDTTKDTVIWGQWCDCQLAKEVLNWEAKTTLKDGLTVVYNDIKNRLDEEKKKVPTDTI